MLRGKHLCIFGDSNAVGSKHASTTELDSLKLVLEERHEAKVSVFAKGQTTLSKKNSYSKWFYKKFTTPPLDCDINVNLIGTNDITGESTPSEIREGLRELAVINTANRATYFAEPLFKGGKRKSPQAVRAALAQWAAENHAIMLSSAADTDFKRDGKHVTAPFFLRIAKEIEEHEARASRASEDAYLFTLFRRFVATQEGPLPLTESAVKGTANRFLDFLKRQLETARQKPDGFWMRVARELLQEGLFRAPRHRASHKAPPSEGFTARPRRIAREWSLPRDWDFTHPGT
jgi:hypothetical protein